MKKVHLSALAACCVSAVFLAVGSQAAAPTVTCSDNQLIKVQDPTVTVEAITAAVVQDADANPLQVSWFINGTAAGTVDLASGTASPTTVYSTNVFAYGTNTVEIRVSDDGGTTFVSCTSEVVVRENALPTVECSEDQQVECGTAVVTTNIIQDIDDDALRVEWIINGQSYWTNEYAAGTTAEPFLVTLTNLYAYGTNVVTVRVSDDTDNAECSTTVIVDDTVAPVIRSVKATPSVIWPPNHKLVPVRLTVQAEDCGNWTWRIDRIESNEAEKEPGSGNTVPDWKTQGAQKAWVRAERSGRGTGRIYTIHVAVTDQAGNTSTASVEVTVPHSQGKSKNKLQQPPKPVKPAPVVPAKPTPDKPKNKGKGK